VAVFIRRAFGGRERESWGHNVTQNLIIRKKARKGLMTNGTSCSSMPFKVHRGDWALNIICTFVYNVVVKVAYTISVHGQLHLMTIFTSVLYGSELSVIVKSAMIYITMSTMITHYFYYNNSYQAYVYNTLSVCVHIFFIFFLPHIIIWPIVDIFNEGNIYIYIYVDSVRKYRYIHIRLQWNDGYLVRCGGAPK